MTWRRVSSPAELPDSPGNYALILSRELAWTPIGTVAYVGTARNLAARLRHHELIRAGHPVAQIAYRVVVEGREVREARLISRLGPVLNRRRRTNASTWRRDRVRRLGEKGVSACR